MITQITIYIFIGLTTGLMSGMFGIGGGSIRIPLLNLAGLPLLSAFGINLFVIPFSSSVGALSQRKNINRKIAIYVIIGGILGSIAGAFSVGFIPTLVLAIIFVVTAFITAFGMYLDRLIPRIYQKIDPNQKDIITFSFLLNFITGMRGGSGGSLLSPFLRAMKLNVHEAIATSLFVTIFTAIAAVIIYWHRGNIIWLPALFVLIGSMMGARIGSKVSLKTKPFWLEIGLTILVISFSFITICRAL